MSVLLFKNIYIFKKCMCKYMCLCDFICCICMQVSMKARRGTGGYKLVWYWKLNPGPVQEQ